MKTGVTRLQFLRAARKRGLRAVQRSPSASPHLDSTGARSPAIIFSAHEPAEASIHVNLESSPALRASRQKMIRSHHFLSRAFHAIGCSRQGVRSPGDESLSRADNHFTNPCSLSQKRQSVAQG